MPPSSQIRKGERIGRKKKGMDKDTVAYDIRSLKGTA
jgi:hypothetical protein